MTRREIHYPDGTVRYVFAGPEARPWWRRHMGPLGATALLIAAIIVARVLGHS